MTLQPPAPPLVTATPPGPSGPIRLRLALPLALLAGVALLLSLPPYDLWWLAPAAVALLAAAVHRRRLRAGAGLGFLAGLVLYLPLLDWTRPAAGPAPWALLSLAQAGYLALLGVASAWLSPLIDRRRALWPLLTGLLWVTQEAFRDRAPFGGFPWGRLAFAQADAPFARLAALGGAPLVTFAVAWSGALLGLAVAAALNHRVLPAVAPSRRRAVARTAVPALAVAAACAACGLLVPLPTEGRPVRVAGVQGDVPEAGLEFNAERRAVLDNHARATLALADRVRAGTAQRPDVVIWPENASDLDPYREADARSVIDAAVDTVGVPVLVGAVLAEPADQLTNASIVWTPGAGPGERYAKRHPVPFGEYIPYRSFFRHLSSKVDLVRRDFAAGSRVGTLDLGAVRAGVSICFEVAYDDLVRDTVRDGADLLVVQTNNATFGYTDEAAQQLAMSRLRAVEHGRAVAHVSTVGISALIAPDGSELARSGLFTPAVLEATLPRRSQLTVADRVGGWPEAVLTLAGLVGALALTLGGRGRRRSGPLESSSRGARDAAARVLTEAG